ncbi:hypothetical protein L8P05_10650 [Enterobacter cloacae]|uniref:hypothetical protein n=1 Tax=Enterobacter cloacae complex TaxID=354276 RepID=UPI001CBB5657|nr:MULTISPECIES: hypothetical protein [Enterobacter cloacae complex]MCK7174380.1 hypothetical protein [Enterobacter cloacae]MDW3568240.1 hypothetical protein [Enterobacter asburiae]UAN14069.1 hypothetical protein KGP20_00230 [Enterobacter asburiae]UAN14721.1 hypothetical protein KGP20_15330 [Enterobacter asburiae]UAN16019.1 hypothetical protein KGP20_22250 [Enterobacter asburiae]
MATEIITIGSVPVQITNGANSALISVLGSDAISFADSEISPDKNSGDYVRDRLIVTPPNKIWLWCTNPWKVKVAVTRW